MSEVNRQMNRCRLCGKYPEFCYRYVKRDGVYSSIWCVCNDYEVEHMIRLVGKSVEGLIKSWNELNAERIVNDGTQTN